MRVSYVRNARFKGFENQEAFLHPEFNIFDRNPDPALDELTELAAVLCNADYAYIGWMDFNRLWFKSRYRIQGARAAARYHGLPVDAGEGRAAADSRMPAEDPRFPPEGIPLAGARPCLSYAGTPLITSAQQVVGTLAVLARKPEPVQARASDAAGDSGPPGGDAAGALQPHPAAGAGAAVAAADRTRAGHRTLLCGRDAGFDSGAGGGAGHGGPHGAA